MNKFTKTMIIIAIILCIIMLLLCISISDFKIFEHRLMVYGWLVATTNAIGALLAKK